MGDGNHIVAWLEYRVWFWNNQFGPADDRRDNAISRHADLRHRLVSHPRIYAHFGIDNGHVVVAEIQQVHKGHIGDRLLDQIQDVVRLADRDVDTEHFEQVL